MTFDPEKLRQALLGSDNGDEAESPAAPPDKAQKEEPKAEPSKKETPPVEPPAPGIPASEPSTPARKAPSPPPPTLQSRSPETPPPPPPKEEAPEPSKMRETETPDDLEEVPADDFAPLKQVFRREEPEEQRRRPTGMYRKQRPAEPPAEEPPVEERKKAEPPGRPGRPSRPSGPAQPPGPLSFLALTGGLVSLVAAIVAMAMGRSGYAPIGLTGIGLCLIIGFAAANRRWVRESLSSRSTRYSANVATVIISLLGILILVNVLSYRYHYRIDLSSEGLHSLAPQSIQVLDDINRAAERVAITAFVPAGVDIRKDIEGLVDLYQYHSRYLDFRFVDPDVSRELTESKGIDRIPSVLFELGERHAVATDFDEVHFTSALLTVRQSRPRLVYFLAGHGEPDPFSDSSSQSGLSEFRERLELDNFEVEKLRIPEANGVPAETSLLLIVGPERPLDREEVGAIKDYLDSGGSLVCLLEPAKSAGLSDLLAEYGILPGSGIILDDQHNSYGDIASPLVAANPEHAITASLPEEEDLVFLKAGSLEYTTSRRLPDVKTESLARSSTSSWVETRGEMIFDEDVDTRESQEMALLATRALETEETTSEESGQGPTQSPTVGEKVAHVMVVNDSSFVRNASFDRFYNRDFILNSVNFLAAQRDLVSIRPAERTLRPLDLSGGQRTMVFAITVILIPLLIAGTGGMVWMRRR